MGALGSPSFLPRRSFLGALGFLLFLLWRSLGVGAPSVSSLGVDFPDLDAGSAFSNSPDLGAGLQLCAPGPPDTFC